MPFDPLGIQKYHDRIRERIEIGEPGFAQGYIFDVMISYEAASFRGPLFSYMPAGFPMPMRNACILEELILDVARGEALASPRTFSRSRVERMINDRCGYPSEYPKMQKQARMLRQFFIEDGAPGKNLIF